MKNLDQFHKKHKYLYILFIVFLASTVVSGLFAFSNLQKREIIVPEPAGDVSKLKKNEENKLTIVKNDIETDHAPIGKTLENEILVAKNTIKNSSTNATVINEGEAGNIKMDPSLKNAENRGDEQHAQSASVSATIRIGEKNFTLKIREGSSVFELMNAAKEKGYMEFESKNFGGELGYFIESINGIKNAEKKGHYWIYYINGAKAMFGISNYSIQSNDIITWKYEKSSF